MRHAYGNANRNCHIHSDGDCDGNCHIHSDGDCDSNCNIHANGDGYSNCDSNVYCYGHSHGNCNCDRNAAVYTDAQTSADTASPAVRRAGCSLVWELASEPREFPITAEHLCDMRQGFTEKSRHSLVAIGRSLCFRRRRQRNA
jgi:hypothetical protein